MMAVTQLLKENAKWWVSCTKTADVMPLRAAGGSRDSKVIQNPNVPWAKMPPVPALVAMNHNALTITCLVICGRKAFLFTFTFNWGWVLKTIAQRDKLIQLGFRRAAGDRFIGFRHPFFQCIGQSRHINRCTSIQLDDVARRADFVVQYAQ